MCLRFPPAQGQKCKTRAMNCVLFVKPFLWLRALSQDLHMGVVSSNSVKTTVTVVASDQASIATGLRVPSRHSHGS